MSNCSFRCSLQKSKWAITLFLLFLKERPKEGPKERSLFCSFKKSNKKSDWLLFCYFKKSDKKSDRSLALSKRAKMSDFPNRSFSLKKNWLLIFKMSECPTLLYFCFFQKSDTMSDCSFSFCSISLSLIVLLKWAKMRMSDWANERLSNPVNKTKHRQYKTFGQFLINLLNLIFFLLKFIQ